MIEGSLGNKLIYIYPKNDVEDLFIQLSLVCGNNLG